VEKRGISGLDTGETGNRVCGSGYGDRLVVRYPEARREGVAAVVNRERRFLRATPKIRVLLLSAFASCGSAMCAKRTSPRGLRVELPEERRVLCSRTSGSIVYEE
jgi:hypothetical protein